MASVDEFEIFCSENFLSESDGILNDPLDLSEWNENDAILTDDEVSDVQEFSAVSQLLSINIEVTRNEEPSTPKLKPTRWRQVTIQNRKRQKIKIRRNLGQGYIGSTGKIQLPRSMGPPCTCKNACRLKLYGKEAEIFNSFWDLASYDKQNVYLASIIRVHEPKKQKPVQSVKKVFFRNFIYEYVILISGQYISVCKKEFLAVHGLQSSTKRLDLICVQIRSGSLVPRSDGRGKFVHRCKYSDETLNFVREHINMIPKYTSHYSRKQNPNKVFLDCDMSITELYRRYCVWISEKKSAIRILNPNNEVLQHLYPVSHDKHRRIFCKEFNIGFKLPRSDTCKSCDKFKIKFDCCTNSLDAAYLKLKQNLHQADSMQDNLKHTTNDAKNSGQYDVICFDLQQNLPTPSLTVGVAFYLRKVWTYNFGIHNCVTDLGHMYMWNESVAERGSEEIMSCVLNYVVKKRSLPNLIAFSDNCGGQNKNWNFMSLWQMMVIKGYYESIEHRFLIPGHTRLPCDKDFGLIELRKKKVPQIYTPSDWAQLVKESNRKNPFEVTEMKRCDFFSFKKLNNGVIKRTQTDEKEQLQFRDVRCFKFCRETPDIMYIKHELKEDFKAVKISNFEESLHTIPPLVNQILQKNKQNIGLNSKKVEDLKKLLPYIPSASATFFDEILNYKGDVVATDVEKI